MEIDLQNRQRKFGVDRDRLTELAGRALKRLDLDDGILSVLLVSDRKMRELNRRYRGVSGPTDVLAFPQKEGEGVGGSPLLGDVVISVESAERFSSLRGDSLEDELDLLLVHGILHLAGFDHSDPAGDGREMETWKRKILQGWRK